LDRSTKVFTLISLITVDVLDQVFKPEILPTGAIGIDLGCNSALSITDGENHQQIDAPKFLRNALRDLRKNKVPVILEYLGSADLSALTKSVEWKSLKSC
jgi:hypothetical protein